MKFSMDTHMKKRILATILGIVVSAISIGFFKTAAFGVDPFQSFMSGLDALIPISFGTLYVMANCCLLLFSLFADRHYIGLGTILNLLFTGYIAQYSYAFIQGFLPDRSIPVRAFCLILGVVVMCFSSAFYFTADLGVSTYDAVALILSDKWHVARFKYCRIACDLACVLIGCALYLLSGGKPSSIPTFAGIGTVITAFFMGPLIEFFNRTCARPFLQKTK